MRNLKKVLAIVVIVALLAGASAIAGRNGEIYKTFPAKERISINTVSGDCIIKKGASDKIEVWLNYDIYPRDAFEPEFSERGRYLKLEENFFGSSNGSSEWIIAVPDGTRIKFSTASGNIAVENLSGEFDFNTASGDIELIDCKGEFDLNSASGDVTLENCTGDFRVGTASGDIRSSGTLMEYSSNFSTASGDVEVELAKTPEVDMSISTASGRAELNYDGNPIKGYFELVARADRGRIVAPFDFDAENRFRRHGERYVAKTYLAETDDPQITLETASGRVTLREN